MFGTPFSTNICKLVHDGKRHSERSPLIDGLQFGTQIAHIGAVGSLRKLLHGLHLLRGNYAKQG